MLTLNDGRSELWQWDTGRTLTVDADCSQVHFSNKVFGRSIDVDVVDGAAIIPDILLQTDNDLNVWAFSGTAENGYTKISKTFKVNRRNKPADYVFTPPDQTSIEEIKERILTYFDECAKSGKPSRREGLTNALDVSRMTLLNWQKDGGERGELIRSAKVIRSASCGRNTAANMSTQRIFSLVIFQMMILIIFMGRTAYIINKEMTAGESV